MTVNRNFICLEITKWDDHRIRWRWAGRRMRQENTRRPLDWNLNLKWTCWSWEDGEVCLEQVTRLWGNELNPQVERVTGDWSWKEDDERLGAKDK